MATVELRDIVGGGESSFALQYGALCGLFTAALLARVQGLLGRNEVVDAAMAGARVVLPAIAILWAAAALSSMTGGELMERVSEVASEQPLASSPGAGQDDLGAPDPYYQKDHRLYTGDFLKSKLLDQSEGGCGAFTDLAADDCVCVGGRGGFFAPGPVGERWVFWCRWSSASLTRC